jgi:hypothetical protein
LLPAGSFALTLLTECRPATIGIGMRFVLWSVLVVLALGWNGAQAQSRVEMERCRAIADDSRRLKCYDAIQLSTSAPRSKYERLDLTDFKKYALTYRGDLVEVTGWVTPGPELLQLGSDEFDKTPIPVEYSLLARRDREDFLTACGTGCEATVQGRVKPVNFTTGIAADVLFVH